MAGTAAGAAKRKMQGVSATHVIFDEAPVYVVPKGRALMHQGKRLEAGDVVEGAHLWVRLESWINTGKIVKR